MIARELAAEVLAHIRRDDKTPEQGADDHELVGEIREQVIDEIHQMTSYDCDGDGRAIQSLKSWRRTDPNDLSGIWYAWQHLCWRHIPPNENRRDQNNG